MFVLRSLFWLTTVVLLLPPSADSHEPAPRVSMLHAAYAARVLVQDVTGVCERHPEECATSKDAMTLISRKLETGADIVSTGIGNALAGAGPNTDHGTLTRADMEPAWSLALARQ